MKKTKRRKKNHHKEGRTEARKAPQRASDQHLGLEKLVCQRVKTGVEMSEGPRVLLDGALASKQGRPCISSLSDVELHVAQALTCLVCCVACRIAPVVRPSCAGAHSTINAAWTREIKFKAALRPDTSSGMPSGPNIKVLHARQATNGERTGVVAGC
jgi:hypothetical protein